MESVHYISVYVCICKSDKAEDKKLRGNWGQGRAWWGLEDTEIMQRRYSGTKVPQIK